MDLSERVGWMLTGMVLGFVLGYIVRSLREIEKSQRETKKEVHEINDIVKHKKDQKGFMRFPIVADALYFLVLILVVWGAFASQHAVNEAQKTQECIREFNVKQGEALQNRDEAIKAGTLAEIDLWTTYNSLYRAAKVDPKEIPSLQEKLNDEIFEYRQKLERLQAVRERFSYPDPDFIKNCEGNPDE